MSLPAPIVPVARPDTHDVAALARHVIFNQGGQTDSTSARRVVNHYLYNELSFINTQTGEIGLAALPLETRAELYKSIASDRDSNDARDVVRMGALAEAMKLDAAFYERRLESLQNYWTKLPELEKKWEAKHGLSHGTGLVGVLSKLYADSPDLSQAQKEDVVRFLAETNAEHRGVSKPEVVFYTGAANDCGWHKDGTIGVNTASTWFLRTPSKLVNTILHETNHHADHKLVDDYRAGKVTRDNPDYAPAVILDANFSHDGRGYFRADNPVGHWVYEKLNSSETSSNFVGEAGMELGRQAVAARQNDVAASRPSAPSSRSPKPAAALTV